MFYYAEIDREYMVLNTHSLTEPSTNANYVPITESQYASGDLVGQYYNSLLGIFEIIDMMNYMGNSNWMTHKETTMPLSTKTDNMEAEIRAKADINHAHDGYASADDLELLEDVINEKANANHTHNEYAPVSHVHSDYVTVVALDTLNEEVDSKADANHTHAEYANVSHVHDNYASVSHAHSNYANATHEHDDYALLNHSHTASEIGAATSSHNHDSDYADINHSHSGVYADFGHNHDSDYASIEHSHDNYATVTALDEVSAIVSGKANASHNHDGVYDVSGAAANALTSAKSYTDSKIDALVGEGAAETLNTIGEISSAIEDNQDAIDLLNSAIGSKANVVHAHAISDVTNLQSVLDSKAASGHVHTISNVSGLQSALDSKATSNHDHDNVYYTETEVDTLLSGKANSTHNHNSSYDALGTAEEKANVVQANLDVVNNELTGHIDNADIHFTVVERTKLSGIATGANNYSHPNSGVTAGTYKSVTVNAQGHVTAGTNPTTLAGYGITDAESKGAANSALASAKEYADEIMADEVIARDSAIATAKTSAISSAASDATTKANNALASAKTYADSVGEAVKNDLLGNAGSAYDTLKELGDLIDDNTDAIGALEIVASGKANATHVHAISDITNLQATLNGKAASSHGTHVSYSTTAPVMDGTASAGSASTVARSDHKHPTDTSRVAQIDFDTHASDTTKHITSTERTNWNAAYNHSQVAHAPSDAEKNQNAFSYVKVGSTSVAADSTTDTLTLVAGTNVTITPDATGDSITISSTDTNTTYSAGTGISLSGTIFSNSGVRSVATGSTNGTISVNTNGTSANVAVKGLGSAAYTASTAYDAAGTAQTKADAALASAKAYTDSVKTDLLNGAGAAYDTLKELGDLIDDNVDAIEALGTVAASKANATDLTSHTSNKSNPHSVALTHLGVTATAAELNKMDGVTATTTEINYLDGVTSSIQTQLNGKAASSHGTHVTYSTTAPNANGTATVGTASTVSRSDHVHPAQTTVSGNAGTATKLATARTISLTGDVSGSTSFDGSGNVSITATVSDDSHNHTIANVDGLQTALDGKSATSHNHNSAYISKDLQFTGDNGGAIISINRDDGKNLLTELAALPAGFYTVYSQSGTAGNPKTTEAWRFMVHKTGATAGWVQGYGSIGSVYTNYIDGTNGWRGWRCIWDNDPNPLWSGQYYMSSPNSTPQTVTPSKKLSECRTGWLLLWSDYDPGSGSNDSDFVTTIIPKNDPSGNKWGGKSFLCDIPRYVGSNAEDVDTERRIIKPIYVHDDCIKGSYQNDKDERNDVVLRAVYEI